MFGIIETSIVKILQENIKSVPKDNIQSMKPDLKIGKNLPAISVVNMDFKIEEIGIGGSTGPNKQLQDIFSGDGKKTKFTLTKKPLRPITKVEHPLGKQKKESDDYIVDYGKGSITFHSPPQEGKDNILIKYLLPFETKGLKFDMKYFLQIWTHDKAQRDSITIDVIKTLLKEASTLVQQGILIKPIRGSNYSLGEEIPEGVYIKTLEYSVKTELNVEIPFPRVEKIEIQKT
jgi:hypothetical protein